MKEQEYSGNNFSVPEKLKKFIFPATALVLTVAAAACGDDDTGDKDRDTAAPFRTGVERTFTPTALPTEEATPIVTALPTPEPTLEPTTVYVPPLVTLMPTLPPTLEPTPVPTPVPTPTPIPLELCNNGRFLYPLDGDTIPTRVNVRAQLAHNDDWDSSCRQEKYIPLADVILIDRYHHYYSWSLGCGGNINDLNPKVMTCKRDGVLLSDTSGSQWGMELNVSGNIVDEIDVVIE